MRRIAPCIGGSPPEAMHKLMLGILAWTAIMGAAAYTIVVLAASFQSAREKMSEQQRLAANATLAALRARIEPHFLYNALETVSGLVRTDPPAAERAIARLGTLLRRVLHDDRFDQADMMVPVGDELAFVEDYVEIEKLRLGARLHFVERIDDASLGCAVPLFTLQLLVENAIKHGIAPKAEGGTVAVTAEVVDDRLVVVVSDDGLGTDANLLPCGNGNGRGIGLLAGRLRARFGDDVTLDFAGRKGHGFSVRMSIPAREAE